jgi:CheY-like chemotaxis protein
VLGVADTGIGMPKHVLDRIFDPFFTTKEAGKGTGLGLSTVLGIVRSHQGFLNVDSEPGRGTLFKVYLPAAEPAATAPQHAAAADHLPRGRGELVLLVDDEAPVREIGKRILDAFGYRVLVAEDGAQAIALFTTAPAPITVVLTDMMMPVMDGPALIVALRSIDPRIRLIASSGLTATEHVAQATRLGVKHFLAKPYTADQLLGLLRTVLDEPPPPARPAA